MIQVYWKQSVLVFISFEETLPFFELPIKDTAIPEELTKAVSKPFFGEIIAMAEKHKAAYMIRSHEVSSIFACFCASLDEVVVAAGGIIRSPDDKLLMIFRRGHWDLPKGKVEAGEALSEAAIREVMEETGLKQVECSDYAGATHHIYEQAGKRILKISEWFNMRASGQSFIPQTEEDIERVVWADAQFCQQALKEPMYANIRPWIEAFIRDAEF